MRKNYCQLFHLEKIICSLKNFVEYLLVGSFFNFFEAKCSKLGNMRRIFKQNLEKCEINGEKFAKFYLFRK